MRRDITEWLIHFVRDRDPGQDFPGDTLEEYDYWLGGELEPDASAFSVLQCVIRLGGLIAGHSFRNGRTTIYGGAPVVCATEMPLYSFSQYARSHRDHGNVSVYGVAFLKGEFYAAGGRPVIYGLSADVARMVANTDYRRMFDESILPIQEQYRYVAYSPTGSRWIDWSHEREWRWCPRNGEKDRIWCRKSDGYDFVPGLPLFRSKKDGGSFSRLCFIVWGVDEARDIQEMLTGFYLAEGNDYGTRFCRDIIRRSSIITLESVVLAVEQNADIDSQTIEGLDAAGFVAPLILPEITAKVKRVVEEAIARARVAAMHAADEFVKNRSIDHGYSAVASAATCDVLSAIVQYMLSAGHAIGPFDGVVLVRVRGEWPVGQSGDYEEAIAGAVARTLQEVTGVIFYVHSRPD